jgi:hypothetical protein
MPHKRKHPRATHVVVTLMNDRIAKWPNFRHWRFTTTAQDLATSSDQKKTEEALDGNGDDPVSGYGRYDFDRHAS